VRRRFVRSSLTIVLSGIALLAVVMVWASGAGIVRDNVGRLELNAQRVAAVVHERLVAGQPLTEASLAELVPEDRQVSVVLDDGTRVVAGVPVGADGYRASAAVRGYGTVTVSELPDRINGARLVSAVSIVALSLFIALVAALVAFREARRLTAPLDELAAAARQLGDGDARAIVRRYGVPELDAVAEALAAATARIDALVADERQLTADVSHQLRTPLTALSIRLEEILAADDPATVREEAAAALVQVERLTGVVDDLRVRRASWPAPADPLPVDDVLGQQVVEWQPAFLEAGRSVHLAGEAGLVAAVAPGALGQILSCLLENSLQHGAGSTTIHRRRLDGAACVEVEDEGSGVPPDLADHVFQRSVSGADGSGTGLAAARSMTEAVGGRLALVDRATARFAVFLPGPQAIPGAIPQATRQASQSTAVAEGVLGNTHVR
jgi:signal transduction histidine kinase